MDEQINNSPAEAEIQPATPQEATVLEPVTPPQEPTPPVSAENVNYATFIERFLAVLVDAVLIGVVGMLIGLIFGADSALTQLLSYLIGGGYYVYMVGTYGATFGKRAMNIRIVKEDTGEQPNYVDAFLREIVGKMVSAFILGIGYLWMLWDPRKQTIHDKIAKTLVVKTK